MELIDYRTLQVGLFALTLIGLLSRQAIRDAIREALDNFRGGPPSGWHPLSSDDRAIVLRCRYDKPRDA